MRIFWMVAGLLGFAALPASAAPQGTGMPHRPPPMPDRFVCKVLPKHGGGQCTANPYPHLGDACSCEGKYGPRPGIVSTR